MTELGNRLKEAREARALTLDDLQNITKIQKRYLIGIEQGNYDLIPGKFYVRAFIKQYAEAVGLNPETVFDEYRQEIPSVYEDDLPEKLSRTQSRQNVSKGPSKLMESLPKILITVFVIGIAVLAWYMIQNMMANDSMADTNSDTTKNTIVNFEQSGQTPEENSQNVSEDLEEKDEIQKETDDQETENLEGEESSNEPQKLNIVSQEGSSTAFELINTDEFKFEMKVTSGGRSWVKVDNTSGKEVYSGLIDDGNPQTFDFSNEQEISLRIGAANVTDILINGEKLEYASDATVQNIKIQYKKEGAQ